MLDVLKLAYQSLKRNPFQDYVQFSDVSTRDLVTVDDNGMVYGLYNIVSIKV